MGLLDDLRNQADNQRATEEEKAARRAEREQFYQEKILPRMVKAYQFFNELVEHLNYVKLETIVNYPLLPEGKPQPLRQEGYKVVIDSSKAIKRIDFSIEGVLDSPVPFEIFGKDAVMKHADRIERYSFRHDRKDKKDPASMEVISAKFVLVGPMPLKVTVEVDVDASQIIVTVRNFNEPGFTRYPLTVEQFSDEFLDQLGKFVLRKEDRLFGKSEELSEEAKKQLRDRMIVEARIRQQELIEAEERRKAEEAAEKERSAKEQIKRAVNTKVAKGKDSLKDMFNKLKVQAGFESTPEQPQASATTQQAPVPPAAPAQTTQKAPVPPAAPVQTTQQAPVPPAAAKMTQPKATQQAPVPPAVPKTAVPNANSNAQSSDSSTPNPFLTLGRSIGQKVKDVASTTDKPDTSTQEFVMPAAVKTAAPNPKRHAQSSISSKANPFLKPEDLEEVPASTTNADDSDNQEKPVLKPGELNTELVVDLTKSQANQEQEDSEQKENSSTPPVEAATPGENPFLKIGGQNSGLSATSSPTQVANNPNKGSSQTSAPPNQNPLLKRAEPNAELSVNSSPTLGDQNQQETIAEEKLSSMPPASTVSTQKPALQQEPPTQKKPTQKPTVQKTTVQKTSEADLSHNAGKLSLEEIKEDSPLTDVNESAETTQNPALEQELIEADFSLNAAQLSLEEEKEATPPAVADESAVKTQNLALEQELIEADLSLKAAQSSSEEEKEATPPAVADESAVTTQNTALKQDAFKDLSEEEMSAEHKQHPPQEPLSLEPTAKSTENLTIEPEEIDIDLSANVTPSKDNNPDDKSELI